MEVISGTSYIAIDIIVNPASVWSSGAKVTQFSARYRKINNVVHLRLRDDIGTSNTTANASITMSGIVPANMRPLDDDTYLCGYVLYGGQNRQVAFQIGLTGDIIIWLDTGATGITSFATATAFQGRINNLTWIV